MRNLLHALLRTQLALLPLWATIPAAQAGITTTQNLAPNPSFDVNCAQPGQDCQWSFAGTATAGSVSGGRNGAAMRVVVPNTATGEHYLEPGVRVPVFGGTTYIFSAWLKAALGSAPSVLAELVVIEWSASTGGSVVVYKPVAGTTQPPTDWKKLEGVFTTRTNTTHVSIRLRMVLPGTYLWDDVGLHALDALIRTGTCNLAPNADFEQGDNASFNDWALLVDHATPSAVATLAVERASAGYAGNFRSGGRAVKVKVLQSGSLVYLSTVPQFSDQRAYQRIAVRGSTRYVLTAHLLNENPVPLPPAEPPAGWISVVQWTSAGQVLDWSIIKRGDPAKDWQKLEAVLTTGPTTAFVSIRLLHNKIGTYFWDDVALSEERAGERCVDARHYITQSTPGSRLAGPELPDGSTWVLDGHTHDFAGTSFGTARHQYVSQVAHTDRNGVLVPQIDTIVNDISGVWQVNGSGLRMGTLRDGSATPTPPWRCFTDLGEPCKDNVAYPALSIPVAGYLPVIDLAVRPGVAPEVARLLDHARSLRLSYPVRELYPWKVQDVRLHDPVNGISGQLEQSANHRSLAFIAKELDFGGDIKVQENVLVMEEEQISADDPRVTPLASYAGGARLERYLFVSGIGNVVQQGRMDLDCYCSLNGPNDDRLCAPPFPQHAPSLCDGEYVTNDVGLFNRLLPTDFNLSIP